jgi:hypothetical protein
MKPLIDIKLDKDEFLGAYGNIQYYCFRDGSILAELEGKDSFKNIDEFQKYVTPNKYKKFKKEAKMSYGITLGNCTTTTVAYPSPVPLDWVTANVPQNKEEGNNPMYCDNNTTNASTIEKDQRKYVLNELYRARDAKCTELHKAFHMEPVGPTNLEEMVEWIKADKFEWTDKTGAKRSYLGDFFYATKWVDKANPPDVDGHAAASEKMNKAYKDAERVIKIKSPEAGLDALVAFEGATFH